MHITKCDANVHLKIYDVQEMHMHATYCINK